MASEIEVNGKKYLSSKVAARESGYAQDYIGQLARAGSIDAKRSGGLWYVDLDSVKAHKANSTESIINSAKASTAPSRAESVVTFDGKDYVSSKRGSKITGYSQDYVTQLARSGKVQSRKIGNRWYVAKSELIENKEYNDALLATVQSDAVGLRRKSKEIESKYQDLVPQLNYFTENAELMPSLDVEVKSDEISKANHNLEEGVERNSNKIHNIPIKIGSQSSSYINGGELRENRNIITVSQHVLDLDEILEIDQGEKSSRSMKFAVVAGTALITLFIVIIGAGVFLPSKSKFTRNESSRDEFSAKIVMQSAASIVSTINNYAISLVGGELKYHR
jgi:hypothetical protein